jgi:methylphosphotriester-DNA--protein-cysteine methyltransferase
MIKHSDIKLQVLHALIRKSQVKFGGNARLKIYGYLHCASGKRMKQVNRVFFTSEQEAIELGYRPCGHCMRVAYKKWKDGLI